MYIRPYAWVPVVSKLPHMRPSIQIFGYDDLGQSIYVRLPIPNNICTVHDLDSEYGAFPSDVTVKPGRINSKYLSLAGNYESILSLENNKIIDELKYDYAGRYLTWLFPHISITPYNWLFIDQYRAIEPPFTSCSFNLDTEHTHIQLSSTPPMVINHELTILYWDIETNASTGNFSNYDDPNDYVICISAVLSQDGVATNYLFYWIAFDNTKVKAEAIFHQASTEAMMLVSFFAFWARHRLDVHVTYNGTKFDFDYLVNRAAFLGLDLPPLGKVTNLAPTRRMVYFPRPFRAPGEYRDSATEVVMPGVEHIDLVLYCRRFLPGLPNYRLETVAQRILGVGKTGLDYREMFRIVRERDPNGLVALAEYSIQDAVLLYELERRLDVLYRLDRLANATCLTHTELIRMEETTASAEEDIVSSIFHRMDPSYYYYFALNGGCVYHQPDVIRPPASGLYPGLTLCDLQPLLVRILANLDPRLDHLGYVCRNLPTNVLLKLLYSSGVNGLKLEDGTKLNPVGQLHRELTNRGLGLVGLTYEGLWYLGDKLPDDLPVIQRYDLVAVFSSEASVRLVKTDNSYTITRYGRHYLSRAEFPLLERLVDQYLRDVSLGKPVLRRKPPPLDDVPVGDLILNVKIHAHVYYDSTSKARKAQLSRLLQNRGVKVTTWYALRYICVLSKDNFHLLVDDADILTSSSINQGYYTDRIKRAYADLNKLVLFT